MLAMGERKLAKGVVALPSTPHTPTVDPKRTKQGNDMSDELTPDVTAAINGVWESHKGLQEDQIISVLHEAVKAVGGDLDEEEYRRIGFEIAAGTYR
jgi:hypothetical protein